MRYLKHLMIVPIAWLNVSTWAADPGSDAVEADKKSSQPKSVLMEAELPEGFPMPGRPGIVVDKTYPTYRAAATEGGEAAFGRLFRHIQKHDIPMTAPVEMTLDDAGKGERGESADEVGQKYEVGRMLFMYASPTTGETGPDGMVEVIDIPEMRVLSVGWFGSQNGEAAQSAIDQLRQAVSERDDIEAAGPMRVMGYNSPMVPAEKRFFEAQVPVRSKPGETTGSAENPTPSEAGD